MSYELFVSIRHLSAKKSQKFISLNTWISIAGVGLGVMALIVVIAVMSGFSKDLRDKILGTNSHVVVSNMNRTMVEKYNDILEWDSIGHMTLMSELEDGFNISIDTDDIIDFSSFKKGIQILKKYKII